MPSTKKTEGKRKNRTSDKSCTSIKKAVSKKKSVILENESSYLQPQASQSVPVSTLPPSEQPSVSASTGQAILTTLSQIDTSNKELSKRMDQLERNGSMSLTPLTSPILNHHSSSVAVPPPIRPQPPSQDAGVRATIVRPGDFVSSRITQQPVHNTIGRDAVVPGVDVLSSIPSISSAVTQLLASYDQQAVQDAFPGKGLTNRSGNLGGLILLTPLWSAPSLGGPMRAWYLHLTPRDQHMINLICNNGWQVNCLMLY